MCSIKQKQELMLDFSARVDDGDEGFENQHTTRQSGHTLTYTLSADLWWIIQVPWMKRAVMQDHA